jgi:phenylalanyl-tRNA synthetase beta chain
MKIPYKHLVNSIEENPSIEDISNKLFQLGHEHEIVDRIFDIEFTPNRGDCLSLYGLLRDLSAFYKIDLPYEVYKSDIDELSLDFQNRSTDACPKISFLKIDIEGEVKPYAQYLESFFNDLDQKKNNFFTDVSNYILYELGQPTHCYDNDKLSGRLSFEKVNLDKKQGFKTLFDKEIYLEGENAVFKLDEIIINIAGVVGGLTTACSENTSTAIIECAYFNPEEIIGKSLKYDMKSDAAYNFERGVDPYSHDQVLRRFIKVVEDHATIKTIKKVEYNFKDLEETSFKFNYKLVNKIIGTNIPEQDICKYLNKIGFIFDDDLLMVPSHRHDIKNHNDIAEEIARMVGYDNISPISIKIPKIKKETLNKREEKIKNLLIDKGFYEVINFPFVANDIEDPIRLVNPLDSNKDSLRMSLRASLIENLIYNERRQKESIKLFEVSDIYTFDKKIEKSKKIGIIASGRAGKNYKNFSKKINEKYIQNIFELYVSKNKLKIENISRDEINSKKKSPIFYVEFSLNDFVDAIDGYEGTSKKPTNFIKYKEVSEYPSVIRDLSFAISNPSKSKMLEDIIFSQKINILKEVFVFDYYINQKINEIKIGFRFIFQSNKRTLIDKDVDIILDDIIDECIGIGDIQIPGLDR